MEERSLRDLFHMVKKALPEIQELVTLSADTEIEEALRIMREANISQIPVVAGDEVLGVFSYRSLAQGIPHLPKKEPFKLSLPVEAFLEDLRYVGLNDEIAELLDEFDVKDAVLVGTENNLQGILTTIDALQYFYSVASPYFILLEIELSIRELIRASTTAEILKQCINRSLKQYYYKIKRETPQVVEEMTFNDYVMLLRFQGNWKYFKYAWGGTYHIVAAKLKQLPNLRNDVFHFKRELTISEYDILRDRRNWLQKRIRKLDAERKANANA
jgi:hypothetical protein